MSTLSVQITGSEWSGGVFYFEGTVDGSGWEPIVARNISTNATATSATPDGIYTMSVAALMGARARSTGHWIVDGAITGLVSVAGESELYTPHDTLDVSVDEAATEDHQHNTGDKGFLSLAVMKTASVGLVSHSGDYHALEVDSVGRLYVKGVDLSTDIERPVLSGTYASGDVLGNLEFKNSVRNSGGDCTIRSVTVYDLVKQDSAIDVLFFDHEPATHTGNAECDPSEIDLQGSYGHVSILATDYSTFKDNSMATVADVNLACPNVVGTSLWAYAISRGTPTYVGYSDLGFEVHVERH